LASLKIGFNFKQLWQELLLPLYEEKLCESSLMNSAELNNCQRILMKKLSQSYSLQLLPKILILEYSNCVAVTLTQSAYSIYSIE